MLELVRKGVYEPAKEAGVYCEYVQKIGHPYDVIVRGAEERRADLIVIGSRGLGGFAQMLVGSVSNYVAHRWWICCAWPIPGQVLQPTRSRAATARAGMRFQRKIYSRNCGRCWRTVS